MSHCCFIYCPTSESCDLSWCEYTQCLNVKCGVKCVCRARGGEYVILYICTTFESNLLSERTILSLLSSERTILSYNRTRREIVTRPKKTNAPIPHRPDETSNLKVELKFHGRGPPRQPLTTFSFHVRFLLSLFLFHSLADESMCVCVRGRDASLGALRIDEGPLIIVPSLRQDESCICIPAPLSLSRCLCLRCRVP